MKKWYQSKTIVGNAAVVDRSNSAVAAVQQQEALTDAQIDDLFREAAKL